MSTLATAQQRALYRAREIARAGYRTFDSETTGLKGEDEIISWAVCDACGTILGSGRVKPTVPISDGAYAVHGITGEELVDAPTFADAWPQIWSLLEGHEIVIYNSDFDRRLLWQSGLAHKIKVPAFPTTCAMFLFAQFYGETHEYWGGQTWQKLSTAIESFDITLEGVAHDAAYDATATALLIQAMAKRAEEELPLGWHPPVNVECAGCHQVVQECAEADEVWYCQRCGLEQEVFHRCPGCNHVIEAPATGVPCDDLCEHCHQRLHREMMVLTGAWHYCPDSSYHIVETSDVDEPCEHCQRQRKWKRQQEEAERARQERIERERKEHRRTYAKARRGELRQKQQEQQERAKAGIPTIEIARAVPVVQRYQGHLLQKSRQKGEPPWFCLRCFLTWQSFPTSSCEGVRTYRGWASVPAYLKSRTALEKAHLKINGSCDAVVLLSASPWSRNLYDERRCTFVPPTPQQEAARLKREATLRQKHTCRSCGTYANDAYARSNMKHGYCHDCWSGTDEWNSQITWARKIIDQHAILLDITTDPTHLLLKGYTAMDHTGKVIQSVEQVTSEDTNYLHHLICASKEEPAVLEWDGTTAQVVHDYLERQLHHWYPFNAKIERFANPWQLGFIHLGTHIEHHRAWAEGDDTRAQMEALCTLYALPIDGPNVALMFRLLHHLANREEIVIAPAKQEAIVTVILQHNVAKLTTIYFTRSAARYASQREIESKWEISHSLDWLERGIYAKTSPPSPVF